MRVWVKGQRWGWGAASPTYLGRIKDLLDLQDVGDVPRVLGEGAQGKGILADKSCGEGKGGEGGCRLWLAVKAGVLCFHPVLPLFLWPQVLLQLAATCLVWEAAPAPKYLTLSLPLDSFPGLC